MTLNLGRSNAANERLAGGAGCANVGIRSSFVGRDIIDIDHDRLRLTFPGRQLVGRDRPRAGFLDLSSRDLRHILGGLDSAQLDGVVSGKTGHAKREHDDRGDDELQWPDARHRYPVLSEEICANFNPKIGRFSPKNFHLTPPHKRLRHFRPLQKPSSGCQSIPVWSLAETEQFRLPLSSPLPRSVDRGRRSPKRTWNRPV
jgi:hypothetical protein